MSLIAQQDELVRAILPSASPWAVVLESGRPLTATEIAATANARLEAWYPGQEGGTAVAQTLLGTYKPGGKRPVTFPRHIGPLPLTCNDKPPAYRPHFFGTSSPCSPSASALLHELRDWNPDAAAGLGGTAWRAFRWTSATLAGWRGYDRGQLCHAPRQQLRVEPGRFDIVAGPDAAHLKSAPPQLRSLRRRRPARSTSAQTPSAK